MNLERNLQGSLLLPVFAVLTVTALELTDLIYAFNNDVSCLRTRLNRWCPDFSARYGTAPIRYPAVGSRIHASEDAQ